MVKIENIAREFLGDKVRIILPPREDYKDEWELDLILKEADKLDLLDALRRIETEKDNAKAILKEQEDLVRNIIKRSYPEVLSDSQVDALVLNRSSEIILELSFKFGVRDRSAYEALLKRRDAEIKNLTEGGQPEKETQ